MARGPWIQVHWSGLWEDRLRSAGASHSVVRLGACAHALERALGWQRVVALPKRFWIEIHGTLTRTDDGYSHSHQGPTPGAHGSHKGWRMDTKG